MAVPEDDPADRAASIGAGLVPEEAAEGEAEVEAATATSDEADAEARTQRD